MKTFIELTEEFIEIVNQGVVTIEGDKLCDLLRIYAAKLDEVPTKEDLKELRETFIQDIDVKGFRKE